MTQTTTLVLYNNIKYAIDAENLANLQMSQLKNDLKIINKYYLIKTEKISENKFATHFMVDYEGINIDALKSDIEWLNINYINYKIQYN